MGADSRDRGGGSAGAGDRRTCPSPLALTPC
jgi:hypothetical protein